MMIYYIGLACLFTHELDAVTHSEWRLLFVLGSLPDSAAESTFVALHVPLFFIVLWLSHHPAQRIASAARLVLAVFMVVHGVLHFALSSSPHYTFHGRLSNSLIAGAMIAGGTYLVRSFSDSRRGHPASAA